MDNDYSIIYKPGRTKQVADALSQRNSPTGSQLLILSISTFEFLTQLRIETTIFFFYLQDLFQHIESKQEDYPLHKLYSDIIYRQDKPIISTSLTLQHKFMEEFHSTPTGNHSGFAKTFNHIRSNVYWQSMQKDITNLCC